ncbi:MAG: hypothetical protein CMM18_01570 [Rhodospirillaceae bacterium]|nr:hypothetical protein [Rhodospirillaceae bacterium]
MYFLDYSFLYIFLLKSIQFKLFLTLEVIWEDITVVENWDVIIVGAGTAGIPAAIFAGQRGAKVLLLDAADKIGGTLHLTTGQMSAAGTALQKKLGINDNPKDHFDDVMRISENTADRDLVKLAVDNAADTFDWLMNNGFTPLKNHPVLGNAHEPYSERRYYWGPYAGISILEAMSPLLDEQIASGQVVISLKTKLKNLILNNKKIIGIDIEAEDGTKATIKGKNVILSTGGYSSNPELFRELSGPKLYWKGAYPYSRGEGLTLAKKIGGVLRGGENYLCGYGAILKSFNYPTEITTRVISHPHIRLPWEIHVNIKGERFFQEDYDSVHIREKKLLEQKNLMSWVIFDEEINKKSPALLKDFSKEDTNSFFSNHPMFYIADDLGDLARKSGVEEEGLKKTISEYNYSIENNKPDPFGRIHRPLKIEKPPFYAICTHGVSITSTVGLTVNSQLNVIDAKKEPINNLFAAGEILGSGQTMGKCSAGGMMLTPALTFGKLLGQKLLSW